MFPDRLVVGTTLPDPVEVSLTRQQTTDGSRTLVHVVPTITGRRWGSRLEAYSPQPVLADVSISLRLDPPVASARLVDSDADVVLTVGDGRTDLFLPRLAGPTLVVLE